MISQLRTYLFLLLTLSLVGVQTACACTHDFALQSHTDVTDHCHDMAMMDRHDMSAPTLDENCDHAPAGEFMTVRNDADDAFFQPVSELIELVRYSAADIYIADDDRREFQLRPRPPPDLPSDRRTVFLN